jgi:hypothetical protein
MNYDINTQHFTMPVHFLIQDYRLSDFQAQIRRSHRRVSQFPHPPDLSPSLLNLTSMDKETPPRRDE